VTRSVLLVPVREVASVIEPWTERTCESKPSHGIPAHVTLLFPCPPPEGPVIEAVRDVLGGFRAFDVDFAALRRFPGTLYLAPEPAAPFASMTEAVVARFPDWPPYGGAFASVIPHLTVAQGDAVTLAAAEADLSPRLPLRGRAGEVALLTEAEPEHWLVDVSFPLEPA
jgi:hypothetical protein